MIKTATKSLYIDQLIKKIHAYSKKEIRNCLLNFVTIAKSVQDNKNIILILDQDKIYFSFQKKGVDKNNQGYLDIPNKNTMTKLFLTSFNINPRYLIQTDSTLFKHIDFFMSHYRTKENILQNFKECLFEELDHIKLKYYQNFNVNHLDQLLYQDLTKQQQYIQFANILCRNDIFYNYIKTIDINDDNYREYILEDKQISTYIKQFKNTSPNDFFEYLENSTNITDSMEEMYFLFYESKILHSILLN